MNLSQHSTHPRAVRGETVRLTSDCNRHVDNKPIPRHDINNLGSVPPLSPDILQFAIEEGEPLVYLDIGGQATVREVNEVSREMEPFDSP